MLSGLRVGVDARVGPRAGLLGVATYRAGLMETLSAAGADITLVTDADWPAFLRLHRWVAALRPGARPLASGRSAQGLATVGRRDLFREAQAFFALHGRPLPLTTADPPDVMHWCYPLPLKLSGALNVYTLHDAIPILRPDLTSISAARHRRLLQAISAEADGVVTVSEQSREDLRKALPGWTGPIVNTYQSLPVREARGEPAPPDLVPRPYLLFCGGGDPRKNLARLLAAHRMSGPAGPLVVVGPGLRSGIAMGEGVHVLGWTSRSLLQTLIRHARALLFPSLAEGFGLPILEAMTLGVPVMTSVGGATAEVAGDAALLVDPRDVSAMARTITRLWSDPELRSDLAERGRRRARAFDAAAHGSRVAYAYRLFGAAI